MGTPYKAKEDQIVLLGQEKSFTIAWKKYSKYWLFKTIGFLQLHKVANQLLRGMKHSEEANNYSMCWSPDLHLNERWRSDCFQVLQDSGKYLTTWKGGSEKQLCSHWGKQKPWQWGVCIYHYIYTQYVVKEGSDCNVIQLLCCSLVLSYRHLMHALCIWYYHPNKQHDEEALMH